MNKLNLSKMLKDTQDAMSRHSPEILTGFAIAGMVTAVVLAVKATPRAIDCIEDAREGLGLEEDEKLTPVETVMATWRCYVPTAVTVVASGACMIGANSVNGKRNAALAAAYNISRTALNEYKEQVVETVGERKEQVIRDKVAEKRLQKDPVNQSTVIVTGSGETRFYDSISKRRFTSDIEKIRRVVNDLNARMLSGDDYVSLNDFYYAIGLERIDFADDIGWNVSKNGRQGLIDINLDSALVDTDGKPSIVVDYAVEPKRGYDTY